MSRPEMVEVPVKLLDALHAGIEAFTDENYLLHPTYKEPLEALLALIPAPEWEPTEEQVDAYCERHGWDATDEHCRHVVRATIKGVVEVLGVDQ